jgi:hypothetical protein
VPSSAAESLRSWIGSGISQDPSGAFAAWLDLGRGEFSFGYAEITGYALTFLAGQSALGDREVAVGRRAADWLVQRIERGNLAARDGWDNGAVYLFDLGMIASGLLSFGARVQVGRFVDAGLRLVSVLAAELHSAPRLEPLAAASQRSERRAWSTLGRAHLAKLVQALLLAGRFGGGAESELAAGLIKGVQRLQLPDGRLPTGEPDGETMLHPHLYAAEGLWLFGSATGDVESLERARSAVEWAWAHQLRSGGFPRSARVGARPGEGLEQSDVTAQATRLALVLHLPAAGTERALARLQDVTRAYCESSAVLYQPTSPDRHLNTWATMFAAQALALAADPGRSLGWSELV